MPKGEQSLTIMTFRSSAEQLRVCAFTRLNLVLRDGETLFAVPLICEPLTCQSVSFCQENFNHLNGLHLADPSVGSSHLDVDILIGSDQYWELVTGETCRVASRPDAINTELGWVLSGPVAPSIQDATATCLVSHTMCVDGLRKDPQVLDDRLKSFWELECLGFLVRIAPYMTSLGVRSDLSNAGTKWSCLGKRHIQPSQTITISVSLDSVGCLSISNTTLTSCVSMTL